MENDDTIILAKINYLTQSPRPKSHSLKLRQPADRWNDVVITHKAKETEKSRPPMDRIIMNKKNDSIKF